MNPPQLEVGLVKVILWWDRSCNAHCPIPRFPLSCMPAPKRPAPKQRRSNGSA